MTDGDSGSCNGNGSKSGYGRRGPARPRHRWLLSRFVADVAHGERVALTFVEQHKLLLAAHSLRLLLLPTGDHADTSSAEILEREHDWWCVSAGCAVPEVISPDGAVKPRLVLQTGTCCHADSVEAGNQIGSEGLDTAQHLCNRPGVGLMFASGCRDGREQRRQLLSGPIVAAIVRVCLASFLSMTAACLPGYHLAALAKSFGYSGVQQRVGHAGAQGADIGWHGWHSDGCEGA
ncbi:hypothetical protein B0T17DRAFT_504946 [Bombardia bombarda]|uniref:Uncharacterized protein n=1 Tax=Bombardia bombarda TaxID=252184 RepID=A0AA40C898_9PEZI|nr:hypothetical protein B0T17DRAFT_504946 [Bombardia bombarda]